MGCEQGMLLGLPSGLSFLCVSGTIGFIALRLRGASPRVPCWIEWDVPAHRISAWAACWG